MKLTFTHHAQEAMKIREIPEEWVYHTVQNPLLRTQDPFDQSVERFYNKIQELDQRVLRVAVNTHKQPWTVVTVFLDRTMRDKL